MTEEIQIRIRKINHAFIRIESDNDIAMELSDHFRFEVPGAKFSNKFKMGIWDGYIRLFNVGSRLIGSGLFQKVIEFLETRNYNYIIEDEIKSSGYTKPGFKDNSIEYDKIKEYIISLNLHAGGDKLDIRDYQVNGVYTALYNQIGILLASVGSGKSMMLYCIIRYLTECFNGRVLLIVPTVGLTSQMFADFKDYSSHNGYSVENNVHLISSGIEKNTNKPIVISTFQSLKDISKDYLNSFMAIITDEGHTIQADSFKFIYEKATEVPYRLACTGSLHDTKCHVLAMQAITGPIYEIALTKDLILAGHLVPMKIKAISLNYPAEIAKSFKKVSYDDELNWIITNPKRNKFIKKLAMSCKGTTLILFRFDKQGLEIFNTLKESLPNREVYYIDGSIGKDERELIRILANSSDAILVFSIGTSKMGINVPSIENIINAHPSRSKITLVQSIGRGLRLKKGKTKCNLYDIGDNLCVKTKTNHTYKHFGERLKLLTAEGYDFDIVNVPFA